MKTKNILRTLLIAVTMLLGANHAQATETTVWEGTFDKYNVLQIDKLYFSSLNGNEKIKVYIFNRGISLWSNNLAIGNGFEGALNFSNYNAQGKYFDVALSAADVANLKAGGFSITASSNYSNIKIKIVNPNNEEITQLWEGSSGNGIWICNGDKFTDITTSHKLRVYANFTKAGRIRFYGYGGDLNFDNTISIDEWNQNYYTPGWLECGLNDAQNGYLEAQCNSSVVSILKNNNLLISSTDIGISKVTIVSEGSNPGGGGQGGEETITHTVSFWLNEAKASSDLWDIQTVAEGAALPNPSSNPTSEQKPGYIFKGWNWNGLQYMPDHDVDIFAIWEEEVKNFHVYTNYDTNYGSVTLSSSYPESGTTVTVTVAPAPGFYVSSISLSTGGTISGSNNTYTFTMPGQDVTVNVSFEAGDVSAIITSSSQLATFSSEYPLDFSNVTALKAYIVTSENNGYAVLERVTGTVAAQTGLVVYGRTADIPVSLSGTNYSSRNKLVAAISSTDVLGAGKYVLTEQGGTTVFSEVSTNTATVAAGHAYLDLGGASARTRQIIIKVGDDATGISDIQAESGEQVIYNLRGQRVEKPTRGGIYIINGKKVLVK